MKQVQLLILILLSLSARLCGQDTISIYFEFGLSKIPDSQLEKMKSIPAGNTLSNLVSVDFVGIADSVGDFKSNMKLSEKRAKSVAKYLDSFLPRNVRTTITALGEKASSETDKNRRVDIILHFDPPWKPEPVSTAVDTLAKKMCYVVDYELLHRSYLGRERRGDRWYVVIETTVPDLAKKAEHYYGTRTRTGAFVAKKVTWVPGRIGHYRSRKKGYTTAIRVNDFDDYKIFKIKERPCEACDEDFHKYSRVLNEDTCLQVDRVVMENMQFRTLFNIKNFVSVRVPRQYIFPDTAYYIGCDTSTRVKWKNKRGQRHVLFYYARLPRYPNYIPSISRMMSCCKNNAESSECDKPALFCEPLEEPGGSFLLNAEIGSHYHPSAIKAYAGIGISKESTNFRYSVLAGTDNDLGFYGAFRYQYHFMSFLFSSIKTPWRTHIKRENIGRYGRLYVGAEIKTRINSTANYLEQNVHGGLAVVTNKKKARIPRMFVQYGLAYNYLGNSVPNGIYPVVHLGVIMKVKRLDK